MGPHKAHRTTHGVLAQTSEQSAAGDPACSRLFGPVTTQVIGCDIVESLKPSQTDIAIQAENGANAIRAMAVV